MILKIAINLFVASVLGGCITAHDGTPVDVAPFTALIGRSLPSKWTIAKINENEIPFGHHWGDWSGPYRGPRGTLLVIVGPAPVSLSWVDTDGRSHRDAIAVESLNVWLMPPGYRNDWRTLLTMHAPPQPARIFADECIRVYARPSHQLTISEEQFGDQMRRATATSWPESPWNDPSRLSWKSWQADLHGTLSGETNPRCN
jgi:hypothetical protein